MKKNKLIAYDLGTGGIKASLFGVDGTSYAEVFQQYETFFPASLLYQITTVFLVERSL